jgi:hypothetical protein
MLPAANGLIHRATLLKPLTLDSPFELSIAEALVALPPARQFPNIRVGALRNTVPCVSLWSALLIKNNVSQRMG